MAHPVPAGWTPEAALASLKRAGPARKNVRRIARNKTEINRHLGDMNRNMKFSNMVMYSISCFKGFAVDAVSIEEMIEEGVIETFLRIQKLNPFNENLHRAINECLTAFCINDDIARMIAERLGGGEQIIHSLLKHTEPETVAASCSAMAKLMRIDPNVDMFVAAECTPALGSVSQRMREEPGVMAAVAECVRAITRNAGHIDAICALENSGVVGVRVERGSDDVDGAQRAQVVDVLAAVRGRDVGERAQHVLDERLVLGELGQRRK